MDPHMFDGLWAFLVVGAVCIVIVAIGAAFGVGFGGWWLLHHVKIM